MLCEKDGKWYFLAFHGIIKKDMTDASSRVNNGSPGKSDRLFYNKLKKKIVTNYSFNFLNRYRPIWIIYFSLCEF